MEYYDLTYGLNKDRKLISITEANRGLDCECTCPNCGARLEAKKGQIRKHHFAHYNPNSNNNGKKTSFSKKQCYYVTMHRLAEEIIAEEKSIMAPAYKTFPVIKLFFETVEVEKRNDRKDLQPDIVGIDSAGKRFQIEIRYSHKTSKEKQNKLIESGFLSMEVDVKNQPMDREKLKTFLLETAENRKWLNNPDYDEEIRRKKEEKERQRKRRNAEAERHNQFVETDVPWSAPDRMWKPKYKQQDLFLVGSNTVNREPIVWKEDCFCLCPKENPSIDSYYNIVTKNMNGIFYQDEEQRSVIVNYDRNGNLFYVVHTVTINKRNFFVNTIVSWDGHRILHETMPNRYNNDYHAALSAKKKIGFR